MASTRVTVEVDGRELSVSNLDKVLYPEVGFTKAEVIDYYVRIAPVILGHLGDRGITLKRFPNGVDGEGFFEKRCPSHRPEWVHTAPGPGDRNGSERRSFVGPRTLSGHEVGASVRAHAHRD